MVRSEPFGVNCPRYSAVRVKVLPDQVTVSGWSSDIRSTARDIAVQVKVSSAGVSGDNFIRHSQVKFDTFFMVHEL